MRPLAARPGDPAARVAGARRARRRAALRLADTAIVGHLGRPQIAALGLAGTVLSGTFTIFNFLTYGTTAVVARATGAGQQERAARLAAQALWALRGRGSAPREDLVREGHLHVQLPRRTIGTCR